MGRKQRKLADQIPENVPSVPNFLTITYTYDLNGNVLSVSQPDGNGNTVTTSYTYNGFNEVLTATDPMLNVTTNTYDTHGNLLTVTSPKPNSVPVSIARWVVLARTCPTGIFSLRIDSPIDFAWARP